MDWHVVDWEYSFIFFVVGRWAIAVLHRTHGLFVGSHSRDAFHHSSFLAAVEMGVHFAGELKVVAGNIVAVTNNSGHYKPGEVHIRNLLQWLREDDKVCRLQASMPYCRIFFLSGPFVVGLLYV